MIKYVSLCKETGGFFLRSLFAVQVKEKLYEWASERAILVRRGLAFDVPFSE